MVDYSKWKDIEVRNRADSYLIFEVSRSHFITFVWSVSYIISESESYQLICIYVVYQISDDEDETHPNIDTGSLFRWRHQARLERMEEKKKETDEHVKLKSLNNTKLSETKQKLAEAEKSGATDMDELQKALKQLEKEAEQITNKEEEMKKKEKSTPWNVDTISNPGFTKTVINKNMPRTLAENLTDEQREENMRKFIKENEKLLKKFGMLRRYDDSKKFLQDHNQLVCEETANYLVIWCINLEMEEVSYQYIESMTILEILY